VVIEDGNLRVQGRCDDENSMSTHAVTLNRASKHEQVIESLARELDTPVDHVRELYESEHARLESEARVKTFVTIIAMRLVRTAIVREMNG
jgi:hypothetical protein